MIIIRLKVWFNKPINNQKGEFNNIINNNDYSHRNNVCLEIHKKRKVRKYETSKIKSIISINR